MGTLFSSLHIARSGLAASQVQLDVAGHNISNVNTPGFSRQRAELSTNFPNTRSYGQIGTGVNVDTITRIRNEFLDVMYRDQMGGLGNAEFRDQFYNQVEDIFLEPGPNGLSTELNTFFDSLNEFSGIVESLPARTSVVTEAVSMAGTMNDIVSRIYDLRTNINDEVANYAVEINSLSSRIADMNERIAAQEISGNTANDLRDQRDLLLDDLSKIVNIFTRERADGRIDVLVGGNVLVDGNRFEEVEAVLNPSLDPERNDLVEIRFTRNGKVLDPNGAGELFGALEMRDSVLMNLDNEIDALAAAFIEQINAIHTQGMGLVNYTGTRTASNPVSDPTLALGAANLPFNISTGTFEVNVYDESVSPPTPVGGSPVTINITPATTMNDLVAQLSAVPNLSASVNADGFLSVTAAPGFSFANSNDSSNALTALGLNGLFTGFDARTIGVNQDIIDNVELLASRYSTDPSDIGDNTAALAMGELQDFRFLNGGNNTINEFYESIVVQVGIESRSNTDRLNVEQTFIENFSKRRQEISGVSIDEEVSMLIQFQRAFEASARVVTVTDRMLESLLTMAL